MAATASWSKAARPSCVVVSNVRWSARTSCCRSAAVRAAGVGGADWSPLSAVRSWVSAPSAPPASVRLIALASDFWTLLEYALVVDARLPVAWYVDSPAFLVMASDSLATCVVA